MQLCEVPNGSYVRILKQDFLRDKKEGDQLTIYDEIDQKYAEEEGAPVRVPPGAEPIDRSSVIYFDYIDGMYSFCLKLKEDGLPDFDSRPIHPALWTDVEVVDTLEILSPEQLRKFINGR